MAIKKEKEEIVEKDGSFSSRRKEKEKQYLAAIAKSFKNNELMQTADAVRYKASPRLSSGIFALDLALGGGWPRGRISLVAGKYSCGKTRVAIQTIVEAQKRSMVTGKIIDASTPNEEKIPFKCAYIDAEGTFEVAWAEHCGVNSQELVLARTSSQEEAGEILISAVSSGVYDLIILDSLAQLMPQDDVDAAMDESSFGTASAKNNNKIFRKLQSHLNKYQLNSEDHVLPTILILNQVREKIGVMFGPKTTYPGGIGQSFYSSVIVELSASKTEFENQKEKINPIIGHYNFKVEKNKVSTAKIEGSFLMGLEDDPDGNFKKGEFIEAKQIWDQFMALDYFKKEGNTYTFNQEKFTTQKDLFDKYFRNREYLAYMKQQLLEFLLSRKKDQTLKV